MTPLFPDAIASALEFYLPLQKVVWGFCGRFGGCAMWKRRSERKPVDIADTSGDHMM